MINKIKSLNNFGIFKDFKWSEDIPEFSKYNLIYGWNRSGKTTLSRLFTVLNKKTLDCNEYPKSSNFTVLCNGEEYSQDNIQDSSIPIRVFNSFFVEENLRFDNENQTCEPILYISEEDIENKKKLELLKVESEKHRQEHEKLQTTKNTKTKEEDSFRESLSRRVRDVCNYKQSEFTKAHLKNIDSKNISFELLSDNDFNSFKNEITKEAKQNITAIQEIGSQFEKVAEQINSILSKTIVSKTIDRLKNDEELNNWVKSGFEIYKKKDNISNCFFCEQPLQSDFWDNLSNHFSKDYDDLIDEIKQYSDRIKKLKKDSLKIEEYDLYSDLKERFIQQVNTVNNVVQNLNLWIDSIIQKLEQKKNNPFTKVENIESNIDYFQQYNEAIQSVNTTISKHNTKVDNHSKEVKGKKEKLKNHLIKKEIDEKDYFSLVKEIGEFENKCQASIKKNAEDERLIKELENKNSSIGKALDKINQYIRDFFGSDEIQLEQDEGQKGYIIKRYGGKIAKNLSEGEKTAIAFSYFITKIEERDFKLEEGIIYIDDPISSLDSNFIYHCYSLIKNHFANAKQLFISTHNFELFSLLKRWYFYLEEGHKKDEKKKTKAQRIGNISQMYIIKTTQKEDNERISNIQLMENCLKNYDSEYHYLFYKISDFIKNGDSQEDYYIIGNIGRRFLEIFLNFKIPSSETIYTKCNNLKKRDEVDTIKVDKVLKLVNDYSHNENLDGLIKHADKQEGREVIQSLLQVVESIDKEHYDLLQKAVV